MVVGVVLTVLEIRNLTKQRQTNLVIRLYSTFDSQEFQKAYYQNLIAEFKDFDDFLKKYGPRTNIEVWSSWNSVPAFFGGVGVLLHRKLIDIGLVDDLFSSPIIYA